MIKNKILRQLELTKELILCQNKKFDRFLIESSIYNYP